MFRAAVERNMSIYQTDKAHYITVGYKEAAHLLGRVDMVLRHIRFSEASTWHANTRSFYARALGTSDYGFVTVLRHPVDRYISDFYYYTEPEARRRGKPVSLAQWAAEGRGGNRMASEFSVRNEIGANEFVASEMMTDGLYLPVELLDYGLAMLAGACGWGLSQVLYLSVNSNSGGERYGHVKLQSRPDMETLALEDPTLLSRISKLNDLDSVLYGAAQAAMLARLAPTGPDGGTAASALASAATRLTAARKRLEAECRDVGTAPDGSTAFASGSGSDGLSASELTGLCTWFSLTDSTYERLPSEDTGYVMPDTAVPAHGDPPPTSWPLSQVLASVKKHLVRYEDPGVKYYHSVLSVRVTVPTAAQASYIYGIGAPTAAPRRSRSAAEAPRVAAEADMRAMARSGGGGGGGSSMNGAEMQAGTAATIPAATAPTAVSAGAATSASAASGAVGGGAEGGAAAAASAQHASQHRRRLAEGSASSWAQRSSSRSLPPLDAAGAAAALSAAVRLWAAHHAGEGLHHLAFCVDGLDPDQRDLVTKAVAAGIQDADAASYTSYEVIECGPPTMPKAAAGLSGARSSSAATATAATDGGTEGDGTAETDYGDDYEDDDEDVDAASQAQEAAPKEEEVDKEVRAAKAFLAEQLADSSPLGQLSLRARWYASVHDLQHLLHGNRGTVRSVLLSYEATLPQAGRVCAPVLPWQAAPFGVPLFHDLTKEEQAAERLLEEASGGGAATSTSGGGTQEREQWPGPGPGDREPRLRGGAWDQVEGGIGRGHAGPGRGHVGPGTGPGQGLGPMGGRRFRRRRRHRRMGSVPEDWGEAGLAGGAVQHGQWPAFGGGGGGGGTGGGGTGGGGAAAFAGVSGGIGRRAAAEAGAGATAAEAEAGRNLLSSSSMEGGGAGTAQSPYAACVRQPCKLEKKGMYHCVMLKAMPHLRRTKVYNSVGKPLPLGRASYKQSYKSPEGQRLEVVHLLPPSKDDLRLESRLAGAQPIKCSNLPLPRLLVPWCPRS